MSTYFPPEGSNAIVTYGSNGGAYENPLESLPDDLGSLPSVVDGSDYNVEQFIRDLFQPFGAEQVVNREYNSIEAAKQRYWASEENQANRDWQSYMSNTSYSRAVADMKNAGLNPILALSSGFGGANTGNSVATSGSSSSYNVNNADTASDLISAILNGLGNTIEGIASIFGKKSSSKTINNYTNTKKS